MKHAETRIPHIINSFIVVAVTIFLAACSATGVQLPWSKGAVITFTGDVMMHGPVKSCAYSRTVRENGAIQKNGFDHLFAPIAGELQHGDLTVGNMEFPIKSPFTGRSIVFNCRPEVLDAMKNAGFDLVTLANNHVLDQGPGGIDSTLRHLDERGIRHVGVQVSGMSETKGFFATINGIRIGVIAYTGVHNYPMPRKVRHRYVINDFYKKEQVLQDIHEARKQCDFLFMLVHAGTEYKLLPDKRDKTRMNEYCQGGVDCVIGHHPHVLQPVEQFETGDGRRCTIFYSLGNFISNQRYHHATDDNSMRITTQDSAIVHCTLKKSLGKLNATYEVIPIYTQNIPDTAFRKYGRNIQTLSIPAEVERLQKELKNAGEKDVPLLKKELRLLSRHRENIRSLLKYYGSYDSIQIR
jgi:poly-gamma-glutamate capsule biosynthesis protein CapA/YwtB (metallophosphatase superfamily)